MAQIEDFTGMDARTILNAVEKDGFPARRIYGRWRAIKSDVEEWLRRQINGNK